MILFRVCGVRVCIEFGCIAVWALVLSAGSSSGILYSLYAVMVHELAHLLVMRVFRIGLREVTFHGCGIRISPDTRLTGYGRELIVLAAGPAANIIMWLVFRSSGFGQAQLILGIMNLLPCRRLDGGAMLECILSMTRLRHEIIRSTLKALALLTIIAAVFAGVLLDIRNFTYYALLLYLFFSEIF